MLHLEHVFRECHADSESSMNMLSSMFHSSEHFEYFNAFVGK